MFSEKQLRSSAPLVVDVSGRGICEVTQIPGGGREVAALTADNNKLISLNGIHTFTSLVQLSVSSNNLVDISAISSLSRLVTLNLQNNSITVIEGLDSLPQLEWLGLAGNSIKVMSGLSGNTRLAHLDLSDNCITELGNISMLQQLKTLLLHGNAVKLLKSLPKCFPLSLSTLSLAENHIRDLNEISFLSALPDLSEVSVMGNPCVSLTHHSTLFDYRPYVVYWCPGLSTLDGTPITTEEKLRSVSLFRSDHTYPFQLGQHQSLVQYLMTACPLPILQNQESEKSVCLDSSTSSLLSQALSLQNPQQRAEVMQKLRVLQVLEQMISDQENLLNTQQQQERQQQHKKHHPDKENQSPPREEEGKTVSGDSSQADTTLVADLEIVEEDVIRPQPSLPFDVLDGSSWSVGSTLQAVRLAWAEAGPVDPPPGGVDDGRGGRKEEGERRKEGETEGEMVESVGCEEPDFDMLLSATSDQCSLRSNTESLTPLPHPGATATAIGTRSLGNEALGTETENVTGDSGIGHTKSLETHSNTASSGNELSDSNALLDSDATLTNIPPSQSTAASGTSVSTTTPASLPTVSSWERMRREFSDVPLQTGSSFALLVPPALATTGTNTALDHRLTAGHPPLEIITEGCPLEVKYSTSVDPPSYYIAGEESHTDMAGPASTYTLESDAQFLPVQMDVVDPEMGELKNHPDTGPGRKRVVSELCSSVQKRGLSEKMEGEVGGGEKEEGRKEELGEVDGETDSEPGTYDESNNHQRSGEIEVELKIFKSRQKPKPAAVPSSTEPRALAGDGEGQRRQRVAAVVIQALGRGWLCRRSVSQYRTRRQAATTIQSTWRGYRSRQWDPVVVGARRELSCKKMEGYVATMYLQLKGCREEMAHQAQVLQLQEETISSLIQEVESLSEWKREMGGHTFNRAASSIQRCWREHKTRKGNQRDVGSLSTVCSELQQQVRDLAKKLERLQEEHSAKSGATNSSGISAPAPEKLSMSKHSPDTILLQWKAPVAGSSPLLGYRVYVNGIEEGMVGPIKHRAFIEGLDTSSTYRVVVRAVYDREESQDSNTLLVAAVSPGREREAPSDGYQREILSLPRSSEPPEPSDLPVLVEKTSTLSKSESCSTLGAVSVEMSATIEARSMSLNLPTSCDLTSDSVEQMLPSLDPIGTSVDPPGQTNAGVCSQTSTSVDLVPYTGDENGANAHQIDTTSAEEANIDVGSSPLSLDPNASTRHTQPGLLDNPSRQEAMHELSARHSHTTGATHAEHDRNAVSVPLTLCNATTKTKPHGLERSKQPGQETHIESERPEKPCVNYGSGFTGKEMASSVRAEAKEVLTVEHLCGQTQPPLTSVNDEGVLQTDTPPLPIGKPSPSANPASGRKVMYGTSAATSPECTRRRMQSPINLKGHRLAANFDANLPVGHPRGATAVISHTPQPPKSQTFDRLHRPHTTQLPNNQSPALERDSSPTVSPTPHPQPDKCCPSVGQTVTPAPREEHSEKIAFSGEEQGRPAEQHLMTSCQKDHWGMACTGILGRCSQQPPATTDEVAHLSASVGQPATHQGLDKHPTLCVSQPGKADTGRLVGPPLANSDPVVPTPWVHPEENC